MYRIMDFHEDKPRAIYKYKKYNKYKKYSIREYPDYNDEVELFETDNLEDAIKLLNDVAQFSIHFKVVEAEEVECL